MNKQMNKNKKLCTLIVLILLSGVISACGDAGNKEKNDDNDNSTEITNCELGSSSIGNCSL